MRARACVRACVRAKSPYPQNADMYFCQRIGEFWKISNVQMVCADKIWQTFQILETIRKVFNPAIQDFGDWLKYAKKTDKPGEY